MILKNHLFADDSRLVDLTARMAPGRIYSLTPTQIIIHFDVCQSTDENDRAQLASGFHYHTAFDGNDHDGKPIAIRQYIPLNRRGSAAKGFNDDAINFVVVNPGPLIRGFDGQLRDVHKRPWPASDALEMRHVSRYAPREWTHWAAYPHEERDALLEACRLAIQTYPTIHTITGHDVTDPGRKFDPGPAFYDSVAIYLMAAFPAMSVRFHPPRDYEA